MKPFYPTLMLGLVLSPLSQADCSTASKQAALQFINSYIASIEENETDQWVANNKQLTQRFKTSYKKMIDDARKIDPEIGLGFDPIVDGQDFVNHFDTVVRCKKSGFMQVSGTWEGSKETMEVTVKLLKVQGRWLIDGSGVINIPTQEQASR